MQVYIYLKKYGLQKPSANVKLKWLWTLSNAEGERNFGTATVCEKQ